MYMYMYMYVCMYIYIYTQMYTYETHCLDIIVHDLGAMDTVRRKPTGMWQHNCDTQTPQRVVHTRKEIVTHQQIPQTRYTTIIYKIWHTTANTYPKPSDEQTTNGNINNYSSPFLSPPPPPNNEYEFQLHQHFN